MILPRQKMYSEWEPPKDGHNTYQTVRRKRSFTELLSDLIDVGARKLTGKILKTPKDEVDKEIEKSLKDREESRQRHDKAADTLFRSITKGYGK